MYPSQITCSYLDNFRFNAACAWTVISKDAHLVENQKFSEDDLIK